MLEYSDKKAIALVLAGVAADLFPLVIDLYRFLLEGLHWHQETTQLIVVLTISALTGIIGVLVLYGAGVLSPFWKKSALRRRWLGRHVTIGILTDMG